MSWLARVDVAFVDGRFGRDTVDRQLDAGEDGRTYVELPRVDAAGKLVASIAQGGRTYRVGARLRDAALDVACSCTPGRASLCGHVVGLLVDVAVHPPLREALVADQLVVGAIAALPAVRHALLEARTLDERLAAWVPDVARLDALELDVEVVRLPSLTPGAPGDDQPGILLRHRVPGARALLKPKDVLAARLAPDHRRIVELTAPSQHHRDALVATKVQASLLVELLRGKMHVFATARGKKARATQLTTRTIARLQFGHAIARPAIVREGDRLVVHWVDEAGATLEGAADVLLFPGPFPYVWSETREIFYPVAPEVDLEAARGFAKVPSLPIDDVTAPRIGRALYSRGARLGLRLPAPEALGLPPLTKPSFRIRLRGTALEVVATIDVVYRGDPVPFDPGGDPGVESDAEAEAVAVALLASSGLVAGDGPGVFVADEEDAVRLWREGLASLRASSDPIFAIEVAASLSGVRIGPPAAVTVDVDAVTGWLEVDCEFRAGAIPIELAAMREALRTSSARYVVLDDGTLAEITEHVATLLGEIEAFDADGGKIALPFHHVDQALVWADRYRGRVSENVRALRSRLAAVRDAAHAGAGAGDDASRDDVAVDDVPLAKGLRATLRPYQRRGIAWLEVLRALGAGGILADDMGLGKTLMTLAFLARWHEEGGADDGRASLVVCPTSLVGNWIDEAARFVPALRVARVRGDDQGNLAAVAANADVLVTTYGLVRRYDAAFSALAFRAVVLDEAQNVKNPRARITQAVANLDGTMLLALTGTPVENRPHELWSIMDLVNPGLLGDFTTFDERFGRVIDTDPKSEAAARLRALVRPFILRRTKRDVLPELPPKTEIVRRCTPSARERKLYEALAHAVRESVREVLEIRGYDRARLSVLTAILRLRQMACDPRLVDPVLEASTSEPPSAKRAAFLEIVRELVREGRRALVFSQFVGLLTLWRADLEREGVAYEYLDGSTLDRDGVVARFRDGAAPLFLVSLRAGGAGLNLTAADTVIHCDPWWNPAVEEQATDRAHRIGQARAVTVIRLVTEGSIEDKIDLLKEKKRELASALMDEPEAEHAATTAKGIGVDELLDVLGVAAAKRAAEGAATSAGAGAPAARDEGDEDPVLDEAERPVRFVSALEIDELRAIARARTRGGMTTKDFATRAGFPLAKLNLLLMGHRVPIPVAVATRMRALRIGVSSETG